VHPWHLGRPARRPRRPLTTRLPPILRTSGTWLRSGAGAPPGGAGSGGAGAAGAGGAGAARAAGAAAAHSAAAAASRSRARRAMASVSRVRAIGSGRGNGCGGRTQRGPPKPGAPPSQLTPQGPDWVGSQRQPRGARRAPQRVLRTRRGARGWLAAWRRRARAVRRSPRAARRRGASAPPPLPARPPPAHRTTSCQSNQSQRAARAHTPDARLSPAAGLAATAAEPGRARAEADTPMGRAARAAGGRWCVPGERGRRARRQPSAAPGALRRAARRATPTRRADPPRRPAALTRARAPTNAADGPSTSGAGGGDDARALLKAFTAAEARGGQAAAQRFLATPETRAALREALMVRWPPPEAVLNEVVHRRALPGAASAPGCGRREQAGGARVPTPWTPTPTPLSRAQAAYVEPWPDAGWVPHLNPDVLLGVVAGDARLAVRALRDWCGALELPFVTPECKVREVAGFRRRGGRAAGETAGGVGWGSARTRRPAATRRLSAPAPPASPLHLPPRRQVPDAASLAAVQGSVYVKYNSKGPVRRGRYRGSCSTPPQRAAAAVAGPASACSRAPVRLRLELNTAPTTSLPLPLALPPGVLPVPLPGARPGRAGPARRAAARPLPTRPVRRGTRQPRAAAGLSARARV
jgi:hypothetical protein